MRRGGAGVVLVLVSAVSFGFMPIFARLAYAQGVGVDELLFIRMLMASLIIGGIIAARRQLTVPKRNDLLVLIGLGAIGYFLQATLYFTALLYSPVAIVALLLYTYPILVVIGAYLLGWENISRLLVAAFLIALVGLVLVANPSGNFIGLGVVLAVGSAVGYSGYILGGTKVLGRVSGEVAAFYITGSAAVSFGLAGALTGSIHLNWTWLGWFWVAMLAVVCTVVAITTFLMGLARIGPSRAALLCLLEPVTGVLASTLLFGNALTATQWFGGVLILAATAITTLRGHSQDERELRSVTMG